MMYRAVGCDNCRGTGYRGRVGVFEVIRINTKFCQVIQKRASLHEMAEAAKEQGMKLLADTALARCAKE